MRNQNGLLIASAAFIAVSLPIVYIAGYFSLGERFGTTTFEQMSSPGFVVTMHGKPFLNRIYPNGWLANAFEPAARLESWLTDSDVIAINKANFDFDFVIDDNTTLPEEQKVQPEVLARQNQPGPPSNAGNFPVKFQVPK